MPPYLLQGEQHIHALGGWSRLQAATQCCTLVLHPRLAEHNGATGSCRVLHTTGLPDFQEAPSNRGPLGGQGGTMMQLLQGGLWTCGPVCACVLRLGSPCPGCCTALPPGQFPLLGGVASAHQHSAWLHPVPASVSVSAGTIMCSLPAAAACRLPHMTPLPRLQTYCP